MPSNVISKLNVDGTVRDIKDAEAFRSDDASGNVIADNDYFPFYDVSESSKKKALLSDISNKIVQSVPRPSWDISDETAEYLYDSSKPIKDNIHTRPYLIGNLLLNDIYGNTYSTTSNDFWPNGSAYIGNNKVVSFLSNNGISNNGRLRCYDLSTCQIEWDYAIKGYHGNSVTYNPNSNRIYICGAIDETNNSRINKIVVVNLSNPAVVEKEITLPGISECYSLTFDKDTDRFYAIAYIGTASGIADVLYIFNEELSSLVGSIELENYPAVKYGISTQGVQLVLNGIAYSLLYGTNATSIYGFDVETGKNISITNIPRYINGCRSVGEVQSLVYDYDNGNFIVGSCLWNTGIWQFICHMFFEVNMFKDILELKPDPYFSHTNIMDNSKWDRDYFRCVVAGDSLKPSWTISPDLITIPNDGIAYARLHNRPIGIKAMHSANNVSAQTFSLYLPAIENYNGCIEGISTSDMITIKVIRKTDYHSDAQFKWCNFSGVVTFDSNKYANVYAGANSKLYFDECNFEDYSGGTTANRYHVVADEFTQIHCHSCTFNGTVNTNTLLRRGSSISIS